MMPKASLLLFLFLSAFVFDKADSVFSKHSSRFIVKLTANFEGEVGVLLLCIADFPLATMA